LLSAVIVSGGKQYRVAPGDRILVPRLAAEPGSELTLERVLMVADGDDVKIGTPAVDAMPVTARVLGPRRGPKIDVLRYKPKKRVRVHRGARADLTVLEILAIGGRRPETPAKAEAGAKAERRQRSARAAKTVEAGTAEAEPDASPPSARGKSPSASSAGKPSRRRAKPTDGAGDGA
jgi:large subunit ribosomal protein L21